MTSIRVKFYIPYHHGKMLCLLVEFPWKIALLKSTEYLWLFHHLFCWASNLQLTSIGHRTYKGILTKLYFSKYQNYIWEWDGERTLGNKSSEMRVGDAVMIRTRLPQSIPGNPPSIPSGMGWISLRSRTASREVSATSEVRGGSTVWVTPSLPTVLINMTFGAE